MVKTDINVKIGYNKDDILSEIEASLGFPRSEINNVEIVKKTLKIKDGAYYAITVAIDTSAEREAGLLKMKKRVSAYERTPLPVVSYKGASRPVIVGAGPAGLFAALYLSLSGACPIVLERGQRVEDRASSVNRFFADGVLDTQSNIQFGEGGAGAFSDGKLKVGSPDAYKRFVLEGFVAAGANEDILYTVGAHLGTDKLPTLVKNIRNRIIDNGGEFIYGARFCGFSQKDGVVTSVDYEKDGKEFTTETDTLLLATGHSARDTYAMLYERGVPMQPHGFGIGVRIEHPREYINKLIYGDASLATSVGTASYHLVSHLSGGRSLYTFCMCPGGTVVAAASEQGTVVTNGMSEYARLADNSNSALLVSVTPDDFGSDHPLAGIEYQRRIEAQAFSVGGGDFKAPVTTLTDFMARTVPSASSTDTVHPSYARGVTPTAPEKYLPDYVCDTMREGILDFDAYLPRFAYGDALLTGAETRTTAPVRILRSDTTRQSLAVRGLYPVGEGAGYAGGIVSSATDAVRSAEAICVKNMS